MDVWAVMRVYACVDVKGHVERPTICTRMLALKLMLSHTSKMQEGRPSVDMDSEENCEDIVSTATIRDGTPLANGGMDDDDTFVLIAVDAQTLKVARAFVFDRYVQL